MGDPGINAENERRFIPRSPFDKRWKPHLPFKNLTAKEMRFQQVDPMVVTGNFGARIPEFMTPIKTEFHPYFIHPTRKNIRQKASSSSSKNKKPLRFQGVIVEWVEENKVCLAGKPPLPRRSMVAAGPFKDGNTHLLFGGYGLLPMNNGSSDAFAPGDKLNSQANLRISGILRTSSMKMDWVTFADTFLIHDLKLLPPEKLCGFGI